MAEPIHFDDSTPPDSGALERARAAKVQPELQNSQVEGLPAEPSPARVNAPAQPSAQDLAPVAPTPPALGSNWNDIINQSDSEGLAALATQLATGAIQVAPIETPAAAPAAPVVPAAVEDVPQSEEFPDPLFQAPDPDEADPNRFRLRAKSPLEAEAFRILKDNRDIEGPEAFERARAKLGLPPTNPAPALAAEGDEGQPAAEPGLPATVEAVRAAIAEARELRNKAQFEDFDLEVARDAQARLDLLTDHLDTVRQAEANAAVQAAEQDRAEQARFDSDFQASAEQAASLYPQTTQLNSAFVARCQEIDKALKATDNDLYYAPNKPLKIAQMVATEMGIAPRVPSTKPAPAPAAAPSVISPAAGAAGTAAPTRPALLEAIDKIENSSELEDFLAQMRRR